MLLRNRYLYSLNPAFDGMSSPLLNVLCHLKGWVLSHGWLQTCWLTENLGAWCTQNNCLCMWEHSRAKLRECFNIKAFVHVKAAGAFHIHKEAIWACNQALKFVLALFLRNWWVQQILVDLNLLNSSEARKRPHLHVLRKKGASSCPSPMLAPWHCDLRGRPIIIFWKPVEFIEFRELCMSTTCQLQWTTLRPLLLCVVEKWLYQCPQLLIRRLTTKINHSELWHYLLQNQINNLLHPHQPPRHHKLLCNVQLSRISQFLLEICLRLQLSVHRQEKMPLENEQIYLLHKDWAKCLHDSNHGYLFVLFCWSHTYIPLIYS